MTHFLLPRLLLILLLLMNGSGAWALCGGEERWEREVGVTGGYSNFGDGLEKLDLQYGMLGLGAYFDEGYLDGVTFDVFLSSFHLDITTPTEALALSTNNFVNTADSPTAALIRNTMFAYQYTTNPQYRAVVNDMLKTLGPEIAMTIAMAIIMAPVEGLAMEFLLVRVSSLLSKIKTATTLSDKILYLKKLSKTVSKADEVGPKLKPLNLGSTGRITPNNLKEQLTMEEIMSNPQSGSLIPKYDDLQDPRWQGWQKWTNKSENGVEIHYNVKINPKTGEIEAVDDFKFIDKK